LGSCRSTIAEAEATIEARAKVGLIDCCKSIIAEAKSSREAKAKI